MATVFKRGKYYYYYINVGGEPRRKSTKCTSKKQAQEFANEKVAQQNLANVRGYNADLRIIDAAIAYEAAGKENRFVAKIVEHWGNKSVRLIKPEWVRTHARDLYPKASAATLNRQVITPLQAIINHAYQQEDGRQIKIEKFAVTDVKKKEAVDADWHAAFAEHSHSPGMTAMARFMWETAARISEACRVMPEDIDVEARTVMLTKTKTKPRLTRISPIMADMLRDLIDKPAVAHRNDKRRRNGVFGYASRNAVYNGWKAICEKAGISYAPPHSSGRVTFATELVVRRGVDPVTAAKLGGWASPKVMMDTYAKADPAHSVIDDIFGAHVEITAQISHIGDAQENKSEFINENKGLQKVSVNKRP